MKMVFTPEPKIFMIEYYFHNGHTVHILRESGSVQRKPGNGRPKVCTEENIETVKRGRRTPIISQATVAAH
jgi:hypothetical protein